MVKKSFTVMMFFALSIAMMFGQAGQVGAIRGTSTTTDGTGLPGVSITLTSPDMVLEKMVTVSNQSGNFRFNSLAPGEYTLMFEAEGMDTIIRKGIVVNANMTVTIDIKMQLKTIEEQIVVEGQSPTIDRVSVTKTTTIGAEMIDSMPVANDLSAFLSMTPGITNSANYTSSQGASVRDNSYSIDGISINDPVVGVPGTHISMSIMEEVSVQTNGLSAEHGSVKGAVFNVITKKGGNKLSGDAYLYYRHEDLQSDNTKGTRLEGSSGGYHHQLEPSITLGGPVIKDKLWFFSSLSLQRQAYYVTGFPFDKEEEIAIEDNSIYPYLKLTYQPSQNDKFVLGFNYTKRKINNDRASMYYNEDARNIYESPSVVFSAIWTHNFGDSLMTNLKIGGYKKELNWINKTKDTYIEERSTYMGYNGTGYDDFNPRWRLQTTFDGTLFLDDFLGSHELKFGMQAHLLNGRRQVTTHGETDEMGFHETDRFLWEGDRWWSYFYAGQDRIARALNVGVFVNDTWNISKNLTMNLGLRFDYKRNFIPAQDGSIGDIPSTGNFGFIGFPDETWNLKIDEGFTAFTWKNISPRLGLIYDLFSDGTTLIKANYSRYYQDNYITISYALHPINWVGYSAYMNNDGTVASIDFTDVPGVDTKMGYKDHDLKTPYTDEFTVGLERELWEDWSIGLRYIRRMDRNLIEDADATALDMDALMDNGELKWKRYEKLEVTDPYDGGTLTFWNRLWYEPGEYYIINPPGAKRDYNGVEFTLSKRYSKNWQFNLSYTYNKSTGLIGNTFGETYGTGGYFDHPNAHVNAEGRMDLERRHQFRLNALWKGPWGINFSGYYRFFSGQPYDRFVRSIDVTDELNTYEEIRAEPRGSYLLPNFSSLNLKVEKTFKFGERLSFKVFCDIFNVFNNNKATSVHEYSSYVGYSGEEFKDMTSIQNPRVFRFGAKVEF